MNAFDNLVKLYDFIRPLIDIGIIAFLLYKAYIKQNLYINLEFSQYMIKQLMSMQACF